MVFLALILVLVVLTFLTDSPKSRYQKYHCQYVMNYQSPNRSTDFLSIGGSKFLSAFSNQYFLRGYPKKDIRMVNLGHSWKGVDQMYAMLRDHLENHQVKNLIILYQPSYPAWKRRYHPNLFLTAKLFDLVEIILLDSDYKNLFFRIGEFSKLLLQRLIWHLENGVRGKRWNTPKDSYETIAFGDCTEPNEVTPSALIARKKRLNIIKDKKKHRGFPLSGKDQSLTVKYYKKIQKMIENQGGTVYYLLLPSAYDLAISEKSRQQFESTFHRPLIVLDPAIKQALYKTENHYADTNHMSDLGSQIYSEWVGHKIFEAETQK